MNNVLWTNNICTVDWTCIHGTFTADELDEMFSLCPEGSIAPTFYHASLGGGYSNTQRMRELNIKDGAFYFSFPLTRLKPFLTWLALAHPEATPLKLQDGINSPAIHNLLKQDHICVT
jgi:hypothetical protein